MPFFCASCRRKISGVYQNTKTDCYCIICGYLLYWNQKMKFAESGGDAYAEDSEHRVSGL